MFDFNRIIPAFISRRRCLKLQAHGKVLDSYSKQIVGLKLLLAEKNKHLRDLGSELTDAYAQIEETASQYEAAKINCGDLLAQCKSLEGEMENVLKRYDAMVTTMEADKKRHEALKANSELDKEEILSLSADVTRLERERDAIKLNIV